MNYTDLPSKHGAMCFRLSGVDKSFANAIRRTLIGNIPILVLKPEDCLISVNTSRFTNEIIKARLACIPIHHLDTNDSFTINVSKKNEGQHTILVTTEDFKSDSKKNLFPTSKHLGLDDKMHETAIEFLRLRPNEEISLTCKTSVGTSNESGMYNSVGTCAYGFTHNESESNKEWKRNPQGTKEDWDLLGAKRFVVPNSFDFILQTVGVFPNKILLQYASVVMKAQLEYCKHTKDVVEALTSIKDCYDVKISGNYKLNELSISLHGDYTIGKLLEYQVFTKFKNPVTYVSFFKKHPHDAFGILRIAFPDAEPASVTDMVNMACDECIDQLNTFSTFVKV
jgi:hypothetical protein